VTIIQVPIRDLSIASQLDKCNEILQGQGLGRAQETWRKSKSGNVLVVPSKSQVLHFACRWRQNIPDLNERRMKGQ
jgi:hypothetical protein